jgi:hypothetical protein
MTNDELQMTNREPMQRFYVFSSIAVVLPVNSGGEGRQNAASWWIYAHLCHLWLKTLPAGWGTGPNLKPAVDFLGKPQSLLHERKAP